MVASLNDEDVLAIDSAICSFLASEWQDSSTLIGSVTRELQQRFPSVPAVFYSYRLRALVKTGEVESDRPVTRELAYRVRAVVA